MSGRANGESAARVLVLDHRDSFVFLLADQFARHGAEVRTLRTSITLAQLDREREHFDPDLVVLSPGPGNPDRAGVMLPFLATRPAVPVLGVCLGHQAIAVAAGAGFGRASEPLHGKSSPARHDGDAAFAGVPETFRVARYHSMVVTEVPASLQVVARTADAAAEVMAIRHRSLPQLGLQFHPESVLTPCGGRLLHNVLRQARILQQDRRCSDVQQAHPTSVTR